MIRKILLLSLLLLIGSTDTPLQTSTVFTRDHFSFWIARVGSVSWADLLLILVTIISLPKLLSAYRVKEFQYFFGIVLLYLFIGGVQNILAGGYLKIYLYDIKVALCLLVGWVGGREISQSNNPKKFLIVFIFLPFFLGSLVDYFVTIMKDSYEYPELFFKAPQILVPMEFLIVGLFYNKEIYNKFIIGLILVLECFFVINRLSFGYLLLVFYSTILVALLRVKKIPVFILLVASVLFMSISYYGMLQYFSEKDDFSKSDGAATRLTQIDNILADSWNGVPILFGKGLGSPWRVSISLPADPYSTGTAMSSDLNENQFSDYQFISNSHLGSMLHKWGVLGVLIVLLFCAHSISSIRRLKSFGHRSQDQLEFFSVLISVFLVNWFLYFGLTRYSVVIGAFMGYFYTFKHKVMSQIIEVKY